MKRLITLLAWVPTIAFAEKQIDPTQLPPIQCPAGQEAESLTLVALSRKLTEKELKAVIPIVREEDRVGRDWNFRLDGCVDSEDKVQLKRMVTVQYSTELYEADKGHFLAIEGLGEARLGDYGKLKIVAKQIHDGYESGFVILGSTNAIDPGLPFVLSVIANVESATKWKSNSIAATVGRLEPGNPFTTGPCPWGQRHSVGKTSFGPVTLDYQLCTFMGGGETTGYDLVALTVTDTESGRPEAWRGKPVELGKEELISVRSSMEEDPTDARELKKRFARYRWNHHNACDSILVNVPELRATYALTNAPMAGCGASVAGGVSRDFDSEPKDKALGRIDYDGKTGEVRPMEFPSYFKLW